MTTHSRNGFGDALFAVAKEPVFWVAGSMPLWLPSLKQVSTVAADFAPIGAAVLAIARIWVVLSDRSPDTKRADKIEKSTSFAWTAATTAAKIGGKWLPAIAAALGAVALVAWLTSGNANASPATAPQSASKARRRSGGDDGGNDGDADGEAPDGAPAWYCSAWADKGVTEFKGKRHNPKVVAYFRDAGFSAVKDDETAWCAAYVNAHLERAGHAGSKSLAAKSFMQWGKALDRPRIGCVVVLHRGDPKGWQGHVGLYAGETATHVLLLGGNQGDAVSVSKFPKSRVMPDGYRWPKTAMDSRTNKGAAVSAGSTATSAGAQGTAEAVEALPAKPIEPPAEPTGVPPIFDQVREALEPAVPLLKGVAIVCALIGVASAIYVIWRRTKDLSERGI